MTRLPVVSGIDTVKILVKNFGFTVVGRRGSHVSLSNGFKSLTVPLHPELDRGTLNAILKEAGVDRKDFVKCV
jgi:predicted RNA binding protein YcfA (HicA-like mRNA interferase family)